MIEDDAWPSAQAFTSWPKSLTTPSFMATSTVTLEPQRREWATAVASGCGQALQPRNICRETQNLAVVDVVDHSNILAPYAHLPQTRRLPVCHRRT